VEGPRRLGRLLQRPQARAWWHRQQDAVLDAGIDGWKLDFGDSYVTTPTVTTAMGDVPHQRYSEAYYRDFSPTARQRRGADFLTMVRPWDESYQFPGRFFARREHAPVVWVGDNRRDWVGPHRRARPHLPLGRRGLPRRGLGPRRIPRPRRPQPHQEVPFDHDNFARWIAVGALTPFMQLHGRANFAPWTVPDAADETVALYRYWSQLHHALVPFFYSLSEEAYAGGPPLLDPIGEDPLWAGDFRYSARQGLLRRAHPRWHSPAPLALRIRADVAPARVLEGDDTDRRGGLTRRFRRRRERVVLRGRDTHGARPPPGTARARAR
jgi:hypothetical protein